MGLVTYRKIPRRACVSIQLCSSEAVADVFQSLLSTKSEERLRALLFALLLSEEKFAQIWQESEEIGILRSVTEMRVLIQ